jgi:hypothetical protein
MGYLYIHGVKTKKTVDTAFEVVCADEEGLSLIHRIEQLDALMARRKDAELAEIRKVFVDRLRVKFGYHYDGQ